MERARDRAALRALASELGHELQGPLNFLRSATERIERGEALDAEDTAALREELDRLSRLSSRLRELARSSGSKELISLPRLIELGARAALVPPGGSELMVEAGGGPSRAVWCHRELLGAALAELCQNALDARQARAGVRLVALDEGMAIVVWDDGPGFRDPFEHALRWGISTRSEHAGLGLTLVMRAARAHGFQLEHRRLAASTEVWLMIPDRALVSSDIESA